ncbi:plasminogen receptor (KT) [Culicoides brevitarsis]|uniref:plasminogen receptor (KT) n=1 Tax=Culicoides brevitarsis TaxID=469753 RepID=UPI00307B8605
MGSIFSSPSFHETFRKNQEYISEMNRIKMERWIQMHYMIKQREMAKEIAKNRELFFWLSAFYGVTTTGLISRFRRLKRPAILAPLIPMSFVLGYYADLAYGTKVHRINAEAEMIMNHEEELLEWPSGIPTVSEIDQARIETDERVFLHPQN